MIFINRAMKYSMKCGRNKESTRSPHSSYSGTHTATNCSRNWSNRTFLSRTGSAVCVILVQSHVTSRYCKLAHHHNLYTQGQDLNHISNNWTAFSYFRIHQFLQNCVKTQISKRTPSYDLQEPSNNPTRFQYQLTGSEGSKPALKQHFRLNNQIVQYLSNLRAKSPNNITK